MDNPWDEMQRALNASRDLQSACRNSAAAMGRLLVGHLQHCDDSTLLAFKRELISFDMRTRRWKRG